MVHRFLLHNAHGLINIGIKRDTDFNEHTDLLVRDRRVNDGLVVYHAVRNNYAPVLKIFNNGVSQGNVFNIASIKLANFDAITHTERSEDHNKNATNNV